MKNGPKMPTVNNPIDAIERGDDVVPLNMGGLEDMEL